MGQADGRAAPPVSMPAQAGRFSRFLFSYYAHAGTFATYASLFFAARGMTPAQIGILMSLIQVMRMVGPNLWGWVADHTHRRVLVLRATAVAGVAAFPGIFIADSFGGFFAAMVLLNLFTSAQVPLAESLLLSQMGRDLSGYGRIRLWGSIGFIVCVTGAGYALEWAGVDSLPWIAGALLLLVLAAAVRIEDTAPASAGHGRVPLWQVLRQPGVASFFASTALMVAAHTSLYVYYSLYLEQLGYAKPVIGFMWALGVLIEIFFFYHQAAVIARIGARRLMMASFAVAAVRFAVIGGGAAWFAVLVLAQLAHSMTFAAHHSTAIMSMQRWFSGPLQSRGQALYMSLSYGVGGTAGGLLMSLCWDRFGPHAVYYAAALLALAAGAFARLSFRAAERHASGSGAPG